MRTHSSIIISITALLIAVFGSTPIGEAAWNQVVPRNSVGTIQIKRNAVKARQLAPNAVRSALRSCSPLARPFLSRPLARRQPNWAREARD